MEQQPERPQEEPAGETSPPVEDPYEPELIQGGLFPHEVPGEHWKADFTDSRQVYQGSRLPIWLLAGWATFIIWALVYLYFGLTKF